NPARCYRVDAHAGAAPFECCCLGKVDHACAGGTGVAHARHPSPHVSNDIDDAATGLVHTLHEYFARHQKAAGEIGAHYRFPAFLRDKRKRRGELTAGIINQTMHLADGLEDFCHRGFDTVFLADIAGKPDRLAAVFLNFCLHFFQLVVLAADQDDLSAKGCQFMSSAATDATAATGDNDVAASKQIRAEYGAVTHQALTSLAISAETGTGKSSSC